MSERDDARDANVNEALRDEIAWAVTTGCGCYDGRGLCESCRIAFDALLPVVGVALHNAWDEGHRFTGYEPTFGENPYHVIPSGSTKLLASEAVAQIKAEGAAELRARVEAVERSIANAAEQPVEDFTVNAWRQLLYMAAHDLRAALDGADQ